MRLFLLISLLWVSLVSAQTSTNSCSEWQMGSTSEVCLMPGSYEGVQWTRSCGENFCQKTCPTCPLKEGCHFETVCSFENLAPKNQGCHDWMKVPQTTCKNPQADRDFEQMYFRICSELVQEIQCTDDSSELIKN